MNLSEIKLIRRFDELNDLQVVSLFENLSNILVGATDLDYSAELQKLGEQSNDLLEFANTTLDNLEFAVPDELMATSARLVLRDLARREDLQTFLEHELDTYADSRQLGELSDLVIHLGTVAPMIMFALSARFKFSYDRTNGPRVELAVGNSGTLSSSGANASAAGYIDAVRNVEPSIARIKIFIASSEELLTQRDRFESEFRRYNDLLVYKGLYIQILRWETGPQALARTRLQDSANKMVKDSDIVVCLFATKAGKYTEEEFDTAYAAMKNSKDDRPAIFTYFQALDKDQLDSSLLEFSDKLQSLGHFEPYYVNEHDLVLKFRNQLDRMIEDGRFGI